MVKKFKEIMFFKISLKRKKVFDSLILYQLLRCRGLGRFSNIARGFLTSYTEFSDILGGVFRHRKRSGFLRFLAGFLERYANAEFWAHLEFSDTIKGRLPSRVGFYDQYARMCTGARMASKAHMIKL